MVNVDTSVPKPGFFDKPVLTPRVEVTFQRPACPGDAGGGTLFGLSDLAVIINHWFASSAPGTQGDPDRDGARARRPVDRHQQLGQRLLSTRGRHGQAP